MFKKERLLTNVQQPEEEISGPTMIWLLMKIICFRSINYWGKTKCIERKREKKRKKNGQQTENRCKSITSHLRLVITRRPSLFNEQHSGTVLVDRGPCRLACWFPNSNRFVYPLQTVMKRFRLYERESVQSDGCPAQAHECERFLTTWKTLWLWRLTLEICFFLFAFSPEWNGQRSSLSFVQLLFKAACCNIAITCI